MAGLFSYGTDNANRSSDGSIFGSFFSRKPQGKPGTFNGPAKLRLPSDPYSAGDLTVTQNPYGPKPGAPVSDPNHLTVGPNPFAPGKPAAAAPAKAPAGFSYSDVPAKPTPSTVNTASVNAPKPQAPASSGFTSTDPSILARVKAMRDQSTGSLQNQAPAPRGPNSMSLNMATTMPSGSGTISPAAAGRDASMASLARQNLEALRGQVQTLSAQSADERSLNDQLAQLRGDTRMGVSGLEGQGRGIPLSLVRGQQAQLQEQGGLQEQTLLGRLAAAQQARQSDLSAAQLGLGYATADQETNKPIQVNGSLVQLNPATGQYETVYQGAKEGGDGFTLSEGQARYDAQGNLIASGGNAAAKPVTLSAGQSIVDPTTGQVLYRAPTNGADKSYTLSPGQVVVDSSGNVIASAPAAAKPPTAEQSKAAGFADRIADSSKTINQLEGQFTGLTSQLGIVPEYLKSENRKLLEQAESNFINAVLRRESGAAISPTEFDSARKQYFPQPGDGPAVLEQKKTNRESVLNSLQAESRGTLPGDDIDKFLDSFSKDLSTSGKGSAQSIAAAIKKVESNGNYEARGGSGEFGAYQFMPSTWKGWAQQYLGNANAPMTPQNQDKVASAKVQSLLDQGYNPHQVALIWNGGQPVVKKGVNQYGVQYDSGAYANKVLQALG